MMINFDCYIVTPVECGDGQPHIPHETDHETNMVHFQCGFNNFKTI